MRTKNGYRMWLSTASIVLFLLLIAGNALHATDGNNAMRRSQAQGIDIGVQLEDLDDLAGDDVDSIEFTVSLDTHVGDLFQFDVADLAELAIDGSVRDGVTFEWEGTSETSHHRNGMLRAHVTDDDLSLESGADVELRLLDIGTDERTFIWRL